MQNQKRLIREWLKKNNRSRLWLAERCHVSKGTVDNWFKSEGVIPAIKLEFILSLIENESNPLYVALAQPEKAFYGIVAASPQFTAAEWTLIEKAARLRGVDAETYIREAAMKIARHIQEDESGDLYAAEDDTDD